MRLLILTMTLALALFGAEAGTSSATVAEPARTIDEVPRPAHPGPKTTRRTGLTSRTHRPGPMPNWKVRAPVWETACHLGIAERLSPG